jgi:hypothetical protein
MIANKRTNARTTTVMRIGVEGDGDRIDDNGDVVVVDNDEDDGDVIDDGDIIDDGNDDSLGVVDMGTTRCEDKEMSLWMKLVPYSGPE